MSAVVVSPHLDDAVLSCWSLLGEPTAASTGTVTVVSVCAGVPRAGMLGAWDVRGGAACSRERMLERRAEEQAALSTTAARLVLLDLLDAQYEASGEDVAGALGPELEAARWVFVPAGIGAHPDHLRVRAAVLALRPDAILYADIPYALQDGWEPPLPGYEPEERLLDRASFAAKLEALACYATQIPPLEEEFGPLLTGSALARELLFHPV